MDSGFETQKTNFGMRISILKILCMPIFRQKQSNLISLAQIYPKVDLGLETEKIKVQIWNLHLQDTICANYQLKWTTLIFRPKFGEIAQLRSIFLL